MLVLVSLCMFDDPRLSIDVAFQCLDVWSLTMVWLKSNHILFTNICIYHHISTIIHQTSIKYSQDIHTISIETISLNYQHGDPFSPCRRFRSRWGPKADGGGHCRDGHAAVVLEFTSERRAKVTIILVLKHTEFTWVYHELTSVARNW